MALVIAWRTSRYPAQGSLRREASRRGTDRIVWRPSAARDPRDCAGAARQQGSQRPREVALTGIALAI
jgi:hypothetical protein